jgi:hypothetical protein
MLPQQKRPHTSAQRGRVLRAVCWRLLAGHESVTLGLAGAVHHDVSAVQEGLRARHRRRSGSPDAKGHWGRMAAAYHRIGYLSQRIGLLVEVHDQHGADGQSAWNRRREEAGVTWLLVRSLLLGSCQFPPCSSMCRGGKRSKP